MVSNFWQEFRQHVFAGVGFPTLVGAVFLGLVVAGMITIDAGDESIPGVAFWIIWFLGALSVCVVGPFTRILSTPMPPMPEDLRVFWMIAGIGVAVYALVTYFLPGFLL